MIIQIKPFLKKNFDQLTIPQKQKIECQMTKWNAHPRNANRLRTVEQQLTAYQKQFKFYVIALPIAIVFFILAFYFLYLPYLTW